MPTDPEKVTGYHELKQDDDGTLADLLFEIGRDLFRRNEFQEAVKWLDRSLTILTRQELEEMGPDAGELKLSTLSYLGLFLANATAESRLIRR